MKIFKRLEWALLLSLLAISITVVGAMAAVNLIDHFDVAQTIDLSCGGTIFGVDSVADSDVLGGERDLVAEITGCVGSDSMQITINNNNDSIYSHTTGNNIWGYSQIQWDGSGDTNKEDIDYTGLVNFDLTQGDTLDRFIIGSDSNDLPANLIITVWTDEFNWSSETIILPGGISAQNPQVVDVLFTDFDLGAGSGADFGDVGAVSLEIDGRLTASLDSTIHIIAIADEDYLDFGDLPDSYDTVLQPGPRNVILGPILGSVITAEADGQPEPDPVNGDADIDVGDDGVEPTAGFQWSVLSGGSIDVDVSNCPEAQCYLVGYIDWNQDGNFYDTVPLFPDNGEQIFVDYPVSNGENNGITFTIPPGTNIGAGSANSFYARFRVYQRNSGGAAIPSWAFFSGETEDFRLFFSPTAIQLTSIEARPQFQLPLVILAATLLLLISGGAILVYKRSRT
jgi:hypothetical protein